MTRRSTAAAPLAERFWGLAKNSDSSDPSPVAVVREVLEILDRLDAGEVGSDVSVSTLSFLQLLRASEVGGDLSYASPEQISGEVVDERSLVFSVGVLIFERLTGRHPFGRSADGRRIARMSRGEFGSGINYFPHVPAGLRTTLMRAMGPFPQERWPSLQSLRCSLEDYVEGEQRLSQVRLPGATAAMRVQAPPSDRVLAGSAMVQRVLRPATSAAERRGPVALQRLRPAAWAAAGAAVASIAFAVLSGGGATAGSTAAAAKVAGAPEPAPVVASLIAQAAPAALATAPAVANTQPTGPDAPTRDVGAPAAFDPDLGGERAVAAVRSCVPRDAQQTLLTLGVGILFDRNGRATRVYLGKDAFLTPEVRSCVRDRITGLEAGPQPVGRLVEYTVQAKHDFGRFSIRPPAGESR